MVNKPTTPRLCVMAAVIGTMSCAIFAGAQGASFDVASVKRVAEREFGSGIGGARGQFIARNTTLSRLLTWTYYDNLSVYRVVGGPSWVRFDRFTLEAKYPAESQGELRAMVKAMLADRFRLRVHNETRQGTIYALVVARNDGRLGPGLPPR